MSEFLNDAMRKRFEDRALKFIDLEDKMGSPTVAQNQTLYREVAKQRSDLADSVALYRTYQETEKQIREAKDIVETSDDDEMLELARDELAELGPQIESLIHQLKVSLLPKDPLDNKNIILEIRAGTGGEEAALFASDLFRMYSRYAEIRRWKIEILESTTTGVGGYKNLVAALSGENVYSEMKYESGVHRVQRVPATEASGRIHTSAVTVAVLPEAEDIDVQVNTEDLQIDVYRSSGPGGQSVNTTDSAVRITHIPTGLVVICQDEKSQLKNKSKALRVLKARLLDLERSRADAERAETRKSQVGTGDRSERIRTYNFPQGRLTDHRINLTLYQLQSLIEGDIGDLISALQIAFQERSLAEE